MKGVVTEWKNKSTVEIETDSAITSTDDTSFIAVITIEEHDNDDNDDNDDNYIQYIYPYDVFILCMLYIVK